MSKTELEELGESVDDLADGFSKYAAEIKQLTGFNIMVEGTTNTFKDLYDIMEGLAQVWDKLTDTQQARVSEILGGTRQLQVVSSILGNWQDAAGAYASAMGSIGVSTKANEKYMETAAAKIQQFKASFEELSSVMINSGTISFFVDIGNGIMQAITWLTRMNAVLPLTIAAFKAYNAVKDMQRLDNISNQIVAIKDISNNEALKNAVWELTAAERALLKARIEKAWYDEVLTTQQKDAILTTLGLANAEGVATGATITFSTSIKELLVSIGPAGWISLAISLIVTIAGIVESMNAASDATMELKRSLDEIEDEVNQVSQSFTNLKSQLKDVAPRFAQLSKGVNEFGENVDLTDDEYAEFISLNNQLAQLFPDINMGMDASGNAMLALSYNADTLTNSLNLLLESERQIANQKIADTLPEVLANVSSENNRIGFKLGLYLSKEIEQIKKLIGVVNSGQKTITSYTYLRATAGNKETALNSNKYITDLLDRYDIPYVKELVETTMGKWMLRIKLLDDSAQTKLDLIEGYAEGLRREWQNEEARLQAAWKSVNPVANAWMQTNYLYNELPEEMQQIAQAMVNGLDFSKLGLFTDADIKKYIEDNIINVLYSLSPEVKDAFGQIFDWRDQVRSGELSAEEFAEKVRAVFNSVFANMPSEDEVSGFQQMFVAGFNAMGFAGDDFVTVLENVISAWSTFSNSAQSDDLSKAASEFGNTVKDLKSNFDLLNKAKKEMEDGGGLSADTIQSLASANENYLDYLYEENGLIKLNTAAWKQFAQAQISAQIATLTNTIRSLNDELAIQQAILDTPAEGSDIDKTGAKARVAEINGEIAENQRLLGLYEAILNGIANQVDGINSVTIGPDLSAFKTFSDDVTTALGKVAELQDLISSGFTISIDKAREFAEVYPEILAGAQLTADGQIALNRDVVNNFIAGKEAELRASIDTQIQELTTERDAKEAYLALMEAQLEAAKSNDIARLAMSNALVKALVDNGVEEVRAYELGCEAMTGDTTELAGHIMQACIDSDHNINLAAYNAATGVYQNAQAMHKSLIPVADAAHNTALAIAGIANGIVQGVINAYNAAGGTLNTGNGYHFDGSGFNGHSYDYTPELTDLEDYINRLNVDIEAYRNAIAQIDGQIALLQALREQGLERFFNSGNDNGSGSGSGGYSSHENAAESWFETEYKLHQHLRNMEMETDEAYFNWLNNAYQEAYEQGIISIEDFMKYQEEVFSGLKELFKDYLHDMEHEIEMLGHFDGNNSRIVEMYREMLNAIEREIEAARARGLTNNDDYLQELLDSWWRYHDAIEDLENDIADNAKNALDNLVQIRINMLKDEIKRERDALNERLSNLKEFYDKQKDMLREQYEEENYLSEQQKKRKKIADIQAELERLRYDNSAWAQRRRVELQQQLAEAQEELDDFEREHALQGAEDFIDSMYEQQEEGINAQIDLLNQREEDAIALYQQALEDIRNGSIELYEEMIEWNLRYGDGIESTITDAWEEAYRALQAYLDLYGEFYEGINLGNYTGYNPGGSWEDHPINGGGGNGGGSNTGRVSEGNDGSSEGPFVGQSVRIKSTATNYSPRSGGKHMAYFVPGGQFTVYRLEGDEVLVGRDGVYTGWVYRHDIEGYRLGTSYARPGFKRVNEVGAETVFTSSNGSKYRLFSGGEKVLTARASDFLYNFATSGGRGLFDTIGKAISDGVAWRIQSMLGAPEINMGDIIINGNADETTVSEIRRVQREAINTLLREFKAFKR